MKNMVLKQMLSAEFEVLSSSQIAERCGISKKDALRHLRRLKAEGLVFKTTVYAKRNFQSSATPINGWAITDKARESEFFDYITKE